MRIKSFSTAFIAVATLSLSAAAQKPWQPAKAPQKPFAPAKPVAAAGKPPGPGANATDQAKGLFIEAKALMGQKKYAQAVELFKKADVLVPGAMPKYFIAECYEKLGKAPEALAAYQAFLAANPSGKAAEHVPAVRARVAALDRIVPPAKRVVLQEKPPTPPPPPPPPPKVVVVPPPVAPVVPQPPAPPERVEVRPNYAPGVVALAMAGAGVVVGATFGGLAIGEKDAFKAAPTNEQADTTHRDAQIADAAFGAAGAFAIAGIVLLIIPPKRHHAESAMPKLAPWIGPRGAGTAATWTF